MRRIRLTEDKTPIMLVPNIYYAGFDAFKTARFDLDAFVCKLKFSLQICAFVWLQYIRWKYCDKEMLS